MNSSSRTVGHLKGLYFPLSQNWIHTQIKHLEGWTPIVLAHRTANLDTVEWIPEYYSRYDYLPWLLAKGEGAFFRVFGFHPSHYIMARLCTVDVLHAHFGFQGWKALRLKQLLGVPLVTTFYGKDISELPRDDPKWKRRYETLFEKGDLFLVEGPHLGKQLEQYGCPSRKIRVHHLGIETDQYPYEPRQKEADEPLRVLMAGRFVEKKGFPDGLKAFADFLDQGGKGTMTIIGDANDSKSSQSLKRVLIQIVEEREISENVNFRGLVSQKELRETYYEHHVILSPSREAASGDNEGGSPVTLIEAQATGLPVISTYHCDIPQVVRDGETGWLVQESDVSGLTQALFECSETDQARTLGENASNHIRTRYAAETCGREKGRIYSDITSVR